VAWFNVKFTKGKIIYKLDGKIKGKKRKGRRKSQKNKK
jgi:hypothetical protein